LTQEEQATQEKINKQKSEEEMYKLGKTFASHTFVKGLISKIHKEFINSKARKKNLI
jgi:hypothetical protein